MRHVDEVAFLRNLANMEAKHPTPRSPRGGVPDSTSTAHRSYARAWWAGRHWEKRLREEWRYRRSSGRHAPLLVGYDAAEFNMLPRGSRDGAFLRRPDWWPDLDFPAVPLPAILAYRATQMRATTRDDARVRWEVALADWVVANLREVA